MTQATSDDNKWMRRAVKLARKYIGQTAPNPAVGCVIVKDNKTIGEGAHQQAGSPHAEIHALEKAGSAARGATAYVTLEPCCHHGKTPPCTDALIAAGIKRVVVGTVDPNPKVSGKGLEVLEQAGIATSTNIETERCNALIADFRVWVTQKRPYVIYKVASTWTGVSSIEGRGNWWITGEKTRKRVHKLRATCDAVIVGANTYRLDNPDLRVRHTRSKKELKRIVVATDLPSADGKLARYDPESVIWFCKKASHSNRTAWEDLGSSIVELGQKPEPKLILENLWQRGIYRILLEGGATLAGSFLNDEIIDYLVLLHGPIMTPGTSGCGIFSEVNECSGTKNISYVPARIKKSNDDLWSDGPLIYVSEEEHEAE